MVNLQPLRGKFSYNIIDTDLVPYLALVAPINCRCGVIDLTIYAGEAIKNESLFFLGFMQDLSGYKRLWVRGDWKS